MTYFHILQYEKSTGEPQQKIELLKQIKEITAHRAHLDSSVEKIKGQLLDQEHGSVRVAGSALVDDWECLKSMVTKKLDLSHAFYQYFLLFSVGNS